MYLVGRVRKFSPHVKWSDAEVGRIRAFYPTSTKDELLLALPNRSLSQIQNKANSLGVQRHKQPKRTEEQIRESKRVYMENKRKSDIDAARSYGRSQYHKERDKNLEAMRAYQRRRFFWRRACTLRGDNRATAWELSKLWRAQKGKCSLTGRPLDRSAQLDHIKAKARGGDDSVSNLRWLCKEANLARRELDDHEFLSLCADCINWGASKRMGTTCA